MGPKVTLCGRIDVIFAGSKLCLLIADFFVTGGNCTVCPFWSSNVE